MQVISSLLDLQSSSIKDPQTLEIIAESCNRVKSMALIHEQLYQSKDLTKINSAEYIQNLTARIFHSYEILPGTLTLKMHIEDILLDVDTAISCGLIINELVSNSLKHAFPESVRVKSLYSYKEPGKDMIIYQKSEIYIYFYLYITNKFTLMIRDNGVGFPKTLDFRNTRSLGLQLVNILTHQLKGTIELDTSGGTAFKIIFPRFKTLKE